MDAQPTHRMTVEEFLAWAEGRPGRYELDDGAVVTMSPQQVRHGRIKYRVQAALRGSIEAAGLRCEMLPDGMTVRINARTAYEPDALVRCGPDLDDTLVEVPDPIIVVEVLSPSTARIDTGRKLTGYFRVPSVMHYLIVDPARGTVVHHRRGAGDLIETRIAHAGTLVLEPPGLSLAVADLFASA